MARTSIRQLARKVSAECNYMDPEVAEDLYKALIRVIVAGLREEGEVTLPGWGKFKVVEHSARKMMNVGSGSMMYLPIRRTLKFDPCTRLKVYVRDKL